MKNVAEHTTPVRLGDKTPLALHICCAPCALEPARAFEAEGFVPTLFWANDNVWPAAEHRKRLETAEAWAKEYGYDLIEVHAAETWEDTVAPHARAVLKETEQAHVRCRACYKQRLRAVAAAAADAGFCYISTTLAVSPYQLLDVCNDELNVIAHEFGLKPLARDFRPRYEEGKKRSQELGLYRQKYCGCRFSAIEAQDGRLLARKRARERRKVQALS